MYSLGGELWLNHIRQMAPKLNKLLSNAIFFINIFMLAFIFFVVVSG